MIRNSFSIILTESFPDFIEPSFKLDLVNSYTDEDLIEMIKLLSGESDPEEVMTLDKLL